MIEELEKCSEIFTENKDNYFALGSYAAFFVTTTVFAFLKKSLPEVVKSLLVALVKAFGKK